jgi:hypothetical protein
VVSRNLLTVLTVLTMPTETEDNCRAQLDLLRAPMPIRAPSIVGLADKNDAIVSRLKATRPRFYRGLPPRGYGIAVV